MSVISNITRSMGWFRYERKVITINVTDASNNAVNLANTNVSWRVSKYQGSNTVYLTKYSINSGGIAISGNNSNVVAITIDPTTDYNTLPSGVHHHELWDDDNDRELSRGDAHLQRSRGP